MLETESRVIGSYTYSVRQLGSGPAQKLFVRLVRVVAPVLGALLQESQGSSSPVPTSAEGLGALATASLSNMGIARALEEFAARATEADHDFLVNTMGLASTVTLDDGRVLPLDKERRELHFSGGQLLRMYKWLAFALEVNYRDFLADTGSVSKECAPPAEESQ